MSERGKGGGTRIFLSYRRDDTSGYAGRLSDDLRDRFGVDRVFRDIDTIGPGVDFHTAIEEAVASCDALVAVIGREWLTSQDRSGRRRLDDPEDFVRLEIAAALERDIVVMPVLVENAGMPAVADLPEELAPLARRNAMEVTDSRWDYDVGRLLTRLETLQAKKPVAIAKHDERGPVALKKWPTAGDGAGSRRSSPWLAFLKRRKLAAVAITACLIFLGLGIVGAITDPGEDTGRGPARLAAPAGLAVGPGQVYVADSDHHRILRITPREITTVAGTGEAGSEGDGGPATSAALEKPGPIALAGGSLYLNEVYKGGIRRVTPDGTINAVAAHSPGVDKVKVQAMAVEPAGTLLVATDREVLRVTADGTLVAVAGTGQKGFGGDGGPATSAKLDSPYGLAVDASSNIYIADTGNNRIRKVRTDGTIVNVAGTGRAESTGDGGPAADANLSSPYAVAVDSSGVLYIGGSNQVRKIGTDGTINRVAGDRNDTAGFSGDEGLASDAQLHYVVALALDADGTLYVSDYGNNVVRRISTDGRIATVG